MLRPLFFLLLLFAGLIKSHGQFQNPQDSVHRLSFISLLGSGNQAGFWFHANNSQRYSGDPNQAVLNLFSQYTLFAKGGFQVGYKAELVGRIGNDFSSDLIQGGLKLSYKNIEIFGGRQEELFGIRDSLQSVGPIFNGNHSLPVPKISIRSQDWMPVGIWNDFLNIKFYFAHGWMEENRRVSNPFLHQKSLHFRLGKMEKSKVYFGITHNALWGGLKVDTNTKLSSSFKDYVRVMLTQSDNQIDIRGETINAIGDHFGEMDFGFTLNIGEVDFLNYVQVPFEDGSGFNPKFIDAGLIGTKLRFKNGKLVKSLTIEYWNTKEQNGDKRRANGTYFFEPDNFYNNFLYASGWSYFNEPVGNGIFLIPDEEDLTFTRVSNVLEGINVGLSGRVDKIDIIFNYIYFENLGNVRTIEEFGADRKFLHSLQGSAQFEVGQFKFSPSMIYQNGNKGANSINMLLNVSKTLKGKST